MQTVVKWFDERFRLPEYRIADVGPWLISLRPTQPAIGSLVLSLRRPCGSLDGLSDSEAAQLAPAFRLIHKVLNSSFAPDKINYLALMMVDPQVHFHVIPRYAEPVVFRGQEFRDAGWPGPPDLQSGDINEDTMQELLALLQAKAGQGAPTKNQSLRVW